MGDGTPKPTAAISSVTSSSTAASSSRTTDSCPSCGVGRSCRRTTSPARVTTPARIFVPPTSTPIAWVAFILSGYRNPPDGRLRRKAVSRLQGRAHERQSAAREPRPAHLPEQRKWQGRRWGQPGRPPAPQRVDVEAPDVGDPPRALRLPRDLVGRGLPVRL